MSTPSTLLAVFTYFLEITSCYSLALRVSPAFFIPFSTTSITLYFVNRISILSIDAFFRKIGLLEWLFYKLELYLMLNSYGFGPSKLNRFDMAIELFPLTRQ